MHEYQVSTIKRSTKLCEEITKNIVSYVYVGMTNEKCDQ